MARFYSNENFPLQVVRALRQLGHDVLTSLDAGKANVSVPDREVLAYAAAEQRTLLTQNRRDFLKLHSSSGIEHCGLILCTADPDFHGQAQRIHNSISAEPAITGSFVMRINRPSR